MRSTAYLSFWLSLSLTISAPVAWAAGTMMVPRLGYLPNTPVEIYLNIPTPKEKKTNAKELKREHKQLEKEAREQIRAIGKAGTQALPPEPLVTPLTPEPAKVIEDASPVATPHKETRGERRKRKEEERLAKERAKPMKPESASDQARDLKQRLHDEQQVALQKARIQERDDAIAGKPVEGQFYLLSLRQDKLLYDKNAEVKAAKDPNAPAPFFVRFHQSSLQGLFDVAVRGSGHRSAEPIIITDQIYWDALKPVMQDFDKSHCPATTDGTFHVLENCFRLNVKPLTPSALSAATSLDNAQTTHLVEGGWYTDTPPSLTTAEIKDTTQIASVVDLLLNIYAINPVSYKLFEMKGEGYSGSHYPDILDEANWGLQYLLTVQQDDGSFPQGILDTPQDEHPQYVMMPVTSESTAQAVTALARGALAFRHEDLSFAVSMMRHAERGWHYLQANPASPEAMLMASSALTHASDSVVYAQAFDSAKANVKTISPQMAVLMGDQAKDIPVAAVDPNVPTTQVGTVTPLIADLEKNSKDAQVQLTQWLTNLYGYTTINFVPDPKLQYASAFSDPLQWAALKTGDYATRVGEHISQSGIIPALSHTTTDAAHLKEVEDKQTKAKARVAEGYAHLQLGLMDRAELAYALALLNQQSSPVGPHPDTDNAVPQRKQHYDLPPGAKKGFFPKLI